MKYRLLSYSLLAVTLCVSACSMPGSFQHKYPDRPLDKRAGELVAQFRGLPISDLAEYMRTPRSKSPTKWVWGETKYVTVDRAGGKMSHLDVCELIVDIDSRGIITNTKYNNDTWSDETQCPQFGELVYRAYVIQPELYEYDKSHNILIRGRLQPEQDSTGLAQKLARKRR
ncbi:MULTISPECIES: hypothetical protein [Bartonella]|nr:MULTISPECIES: hypothetical protein [Bartonella]AQT45511.1 hypothetical protein BBC0244_018350 [Bartonella apihabitans]